MKWFQHDNNLLDQNKMQHLFDRHGYAGIYAYIRLLEIFADHFNPEMPDIFVESRRDIITKLFPRTSQKTAKKILKTFQDLKFFSYKIHGKEIIFNCNIIKNLADRYTKEIMRKKK
ncbi:hypothetical protein ES702_06826 [subsurface metagenome]